MDDNGSRWAYLASHDLHPRRFLAPWYVHELEQAFCRLGRDRQALRYV